MIYEVVKFDIEDLFSDLSARIHARVDIDLKNVNDVDDIERICDNIRYEIDRTLQLKENQTQDIVFDAINDTIDMVGELNNCTDEELIEKISKDHTTYGFITNPSQVVMDYYQFKTKL